MVNSFPLATYNMTCWAVLRRMDRPEHHSILFSKDCATLSTVQGSVGCSVGSKCCQWCFTRLQGILKWASQLYRILPVCFGCRTRWPSSSQYIWIRLVVRPQVFVSKYLLSSKRPYHCVLRVNVNTDKEQSKVLFSCFTFFFRAAAGIKLAVQSIYKFSSSQLSLNKLEFRWDLQGIVGTVATQSSKITQCLVRWGWGGMRV